ncbi:MAG: carbon-nitrogen hydrolase family protein [Mangrovibacterium sp.]
MKLLYIKRLLVLLLFACLQLNLNFAATNDPNKKILKVAGLQMEVTTNIQRNKERILAGIKEAANGKADFLITPEGSLSGYHSQFDQGELLEALRQVEDCAKENKIGLFLGTCFYEEIDGREFCYNQVRIHAPDGEYLGAHSKVLRCSPLELPGTGEMKEYVEGNLSTYLWQGIRFGVLICNDLWASPGFTTISNPYLPWKLKQLGAQIIIHAINSGTGERYKNFHESSVELWAYALKLPIIEVNAAKGTDKINARSGLVNTKGEREVIAPDTGEQIFFCDLIFSE